MLFNIIIIVFICAVLSVLFDAWHYHYLRDVKKDKYIQDIDYKYNWVRDYYINKY